MDALRRVRKGRASREGWPLDSELAARVRADAEGKSPRLTRTTIMTMLYVLNNDGKWCLAKAHDVLACAFHLIRRTTDAASRCWPTTPRPKPFSNCTWV